MKASWAKGYRSKINPETAANELDKIKESNGGVLTAGIVIEKAKSAKNPLHQAFEWNDSKAADEYRLVQARKMLHSIKVIDNATRGSEPIRKFQVITQPEESGNSSRKVYKTTEEIMQDPIARDELLGNAIRELISFRRKYAQLSELAVVYAAMDDYLVHANVAG